MWLFFGVKMAQLTPPKTDCASQHFSDQLVRSWGLWHFLCGVWCTHPSSQKPPEHRVNFTKHVGQRSVGLDFSVLDLHLILRNFLPWALTLKWHRWVFMSCSYLTPGHQRWAKLQELTNVLKTFSFTFTNRFLSCMCCPIKAHSGPLMPITGIVWNHLSCMWIIVSDN